MSNYIQVGTRRDFPSKVLWDMHRLRTRVFKDRMGWEVPVLSGMEIDGYDAIDPYYMVMRLTQQLPLQRGTMLMHLDNRVFHF